MRFVRKTALWRILPLLALCIAAYAESSRWDKEMQAGQKAFEAQELAKAERHFNAAAKEAQHGGPQDLRVAVSLGNLADVYRAQNKLADAERLYRESLAIREKILGPWNLRVALSLDDLGDTLSAQGKFTESEAIYKRSHEIRERAIAAHPDIYVEGTPKPVRDTQPR